MSKTLILIPSRLSASRLPGKPLLKIKGISLINHVYRIAEKISPGNAYVVTGDKKIHKNVVNNSGKSILTEGNHKTGTDRINEGYRKINNFKYKYILNLQGDEPLIDIRDVKNLINSISKKNLGMGTFACKLEDYSLFENKNVVKIITTKQLRKTGVVKAKKFTRFLRNKKLNNVYHHIGVYIYRSDVLSKFTSLKQTINEKKSKLEQLRALENNIPINVHLAKKVPVGVDTIEDFYKVKKILELKN